MTAILLYGMVKVIMGIKIIKLKTIKMKKAQIVTAVIFTAIGIFLTLNQLINNFDFNI